MEKRGVSILLIIIGSVLFLSHPIFSLTGFTVAHETAKFSIQFAGLVMILVGVFLFLAHTK